MTWIGESTKNKGITPKMIFLLIVAKILFNFIQAETILGLLQNSTKRGEYYG